MNVSLQLPGTAVPASMSCSAARAVLRPRPVAWAARRLVMGLALAAGGSAAWAQTPARTEQPVQAASQRFDIDAGPLAPALRRAASQAGVVLSFTPDQAEGLSLIHI